MARSIIVISTLLAIVIVFLMLGKFHYLRQKNILPSTPANKSAGSESISQSVPSSEVPKPSEDNNSSDFLPPLDRSSERVTKKPFGIFITPQNSPVQPEKFRGYHTGTDFEIFPEEQDSDIFVRAICSGPIAVKRIASGYGGVLVQNCQLDGNTVSVVYGHLKLDSVSKKSADHLAAGEKIGILGKANSSETDGERKHLHLGIYNSKEVNILGYVPTKSQLSSWIDACTLVCN